MQERWELLLLCFSYLVVYVADEGKEFILFYFETSYSHANNHSDKFQKYVACKNMTDQLLIKSGTGVCI
jgi:hypothetical protein